jgi:hypothetical protein
MAIPVDAAQESDTWTSPGAQARMYVDHHFGVTTIYEGT